MTKPIIVLIVDANEPEIYQFQITLLIACSHHTHKINTQMVNNKPASLMTKPMY